MPVIQLKKVGTKQQKTGKVKTPGETSHYLTSSISVRGSDRKRASHRGRVSQKVHHSMKGSGEISVCKGLITYIGWP